MNLLKSSIMSPCIKQMRKEVLIALHHAIAMEARRINREQVVVLGRLETSTPSSHVDDSM